MKTINTIETPFGTFTRKSDTTYAFAAVAEAAVNPEQGLRVVGNRKGDFTVERSYTNSVGETSTYDEPRVRYHIVWSRTAAGAQKNAESYVWQAARCAGVFPVIAR